jgi:hypothetical protein
VLPLSKEANVEVKGATFLYALAALMITLAGFSALLLSIRQMVGARLSPLDRFVVRTILTHLFMLTGGALLPPILGLWNLSEAWLWRVAALCFAIPMLATTQKSCRDRFAPSRIRGLYSCGECRNRSDADLHHRRFRVPGSRLYHRLDHQFFYYRVWLCDRSRCDYAATRRRLCA